MPHGFTASVTIEDARPVAGANVSEVIELIKYYTKCKGCKRPKPLDVVIWADDAMTVKADLTILPTNARQDGSSHAIVEGTVRGRKVTARLATDVDYLHHDTVVAPIVD